MVKCSQCGQVETIKRSGFVRGRQRFYCRACAYHFTQPVAETTTPRRRHQTTIIDIAKTLGISHTTVSRALRGQGDISPATRQAVLDVAIQLEYQPNSLARSLNSNETHTIGVIIPDIERPFFASVVSGIQQIASASGYKVMICQSNENHQIEVSNVQALIASRVDGLLICHSRETETFDHIRLQHRKGLPIIQFDRVCEELDTPKIVLDDEAGAQAVVEHLLEEGCRRIAILAGPASLLISNHRLNGYKQALAHHQIPFDEKLIVHSNFSKPTTLAALDVWLKLPQRPDAIFSVYDGGAVDIMVALKARNVRIPQDIAIASFGNEPMAAIIDPGLTTFHQHPGQIGQMAAQLFLNKIVDGDQFIPQTHLIKGELIIRQSSRKRTSFND